MLGHGRARDRGHVRLDPDAYDGEVAPDPLPSASTAASQPGPLGGDLRAGEQPDALGAVDPADQCAELLAEDPFQRVPAGKDRGDLHPELGQEAATSQPMNPMPTTNARRPATASCLIASHSATVRR